MHKCQSCGASIDTDDVICDACANKLLKVMGKWTITDRILYWIVDNIFWIVIAVVLLFVAFYFI